MIKIKNCIRPHLKKLMIEKNMIPVSGLRKEFGFSLVELMVASIISVIILLAASSVFFTTFKLKEQVKSRIDYDQDVRNAANLLRSDARQLGNFSCMNPPTAGELNNIFNGSFSASNNKQYLSNTFNTQVGITQTSGNPPLIMTYINDKFASNLTSNECNNGIPNMENNVDAAVYMVGKTASDNVTGFYRINYSKGIWSAPQLLVSNVSSVEYTYDYDNHTDATCPQPLSTVASAPVQYVENIEKNQLDFGFDKPPVLIKAKLKITPTQNGSNGSSHAEVNYEIYAMVRQGEVCINNQAQQQ